MMRMYNIIMIALIMSSQLTVSSLPLGVIVGVLALLMLTLTSNLMLSMVTMLLFLIYIGGLMVMFSYFLSIQPNTMMNSWPIMIGVMSSSMLLIMYHPHPHQSTEDSTAAPSNILVTMNMEVLLILTMTLLLTLIIINSMTTKTNGPMRPSDS